VRLALAAAVLVALASPARADDATADTISYKVKQGDTLELVAAEFYGDFRHTMIFIMVENKLQHPRKLNPGERLKIPVNRVITTARGDHFETLAKQYLGDPNRAAYLAEFNGKSPLDAPPTGTKIEIPFHVTHVAADKETLAQISLAYFGDQKQVEMLKTYNNLGDKSQLDKGESLVIPIFHVRVRPEKLPQIDAQSSARLEEQKKANEQVAAALPAARTAWLEGDFETVRHALVDVAKKLDFLDTATSTEVGLLLGKAYVAFDDKPSAVAIFTQVLNRDPRRELSAYYDSPRVLDAWREAGGHVTGEK
jgi:LysM repeat protein